MRRPSLAALLMLICLSLPALAHQGPPFPIVVDQITGPCQISIWTDPDIGIGTFFVVVDPLPGKQVPSDLKVTLSVQPVSGRLPEKSYQMYRADQKHQVQFNGQAEFDQQEFWRVRVKLESSAGSGESISQVEATPPGFGRWDLLFYLSPFLFFGAVMLRGILRRRKQRAKQNQPAS